MATTPQSPGGKKYDIDQLDSGTQVILVGSDVNSGDAVMIRGTVVDVQSNSNGTVAVSLDVSNMNNMKLENAFPVDYFDTNNLLIEISREDDYVYVEIFDPTNGEKLFEIDSYSIVSLPVASPLRALKGSRRKGAANCLGTEIYNPATDYCVKRTGAVGRSLLGGAGAPRATRMGKNTMTGCKAQGKILNPNTGRCIKPTGQVARALGLGSALSSVMRRSPRKSPAKKTASQCRALGKIVNPSTGRCIAANGALAQKLGLAAKTSKPRAASPRAAPARRGKRTAAECLAIGKILNRKTGYCNKPERLSKAELKLKRNGCPAGEVWNPLSGRCINRSGRAAMSAQEFLTPSPAKRLSRSFRSM